MTASSNQHVDRLNQRIQQARLDVGELDRAGTVDISVGEVAHVGEIVVTCRNDRLPELGLGR